MWCIFSTESLIKKEVKVLRFLSDKKHTVNSYEWITHYWLTDVAGKRTNGTVIGPREKMINPSKMLHWARWEPSKQGRGGLSENLMQDNRKGSVMSERQRRWEISNKLMLSELSFIVAVWNFANLNFKSAKCPMSGAGKIRMFGFRGRRRWWDKTEIWNVTIKARFSFRIKGKFSMQD